MPETQKKPSREGIGEKRKSAGPTRDEKAKDAGAMRSPTSGGKSAPRRNPVEQGSTAKAGSPSSQPSVQLTWKAAR